MKKRTVILTALIALCLVFVSCGSSADSAEWESDASAFDVLTAMVTAAGEYEQRDDAEYLETGLIYNGASQVEGEFMSDGQKSMFYGTIEGDPDFSGVADYALWTATDPVSTEIGVFKAADGDAVKTIEEFIAVRIKTLCENAIGYKAEELEKAENALVVSKGKYVIYIVTNINDELEAVAETAITDGKTAE